MKPPLATAITTLLGVVVPATLILPAFAADPSSYRTTTTSVSTETVAQRELARRREQMERGAADIRAGDDAIKDKDYEKAFVQYQAACDTIPNSLNSARLYNRALRDFCDAGVALAEQRITEGRYEDAGNVLKTVLREQYDPHYKRALAVLAHLETPGYYNRTITPKYRGNVEQVKQWFIDAHGYYDTARWDLAYKRCEQILGLDPYNIAARKLEEEINRKRDDYAIEGYNNTRAHAIWQLDKGWDMPVRKFEVKATNAIVQDVTSSGRSQAIQRKLNSIIIPKLEFREATIREAIDFLKRKSQELDPEHQGVNIVLKLEEGTGGAIAPAAMAPPAAAAPVIPGLEPVPGVAPAGVPVVAAGGGLPVNPADAHITVSLTNIPLGEALRYVTSLANLKFKVEEYAVSVVPLNVPTDALFTKEWKVPPGMFQGTPGAELRNPLDMAARAATAGGAGAVQGDQTKGTPGLVARVDAKDALTAAGVVFPPGSSAVFLASSSKLIVKNTQENLDLIDAIVEAQISNGPVQVEIESKFVEIQQNNLKELAFDTLVGQANVPGSSQTFFGGGTTGTATGVDQTQYPFSVGTGTTQTFPVSSGLRTGTNAISQNAIDALLAGTSGQSSPSPAVAAIAGIFSDPTFQVVIHAIDQKKGIDLLSAPRVTTKSGQRAVVEVIREFRYPTEFQPPQIPQTFGNQGQQAISLLPSGAVNPLAPQSNGSFPVTPTTPTAFETRNTGVTLEVEPVIGPDNYTIDLNLVPQVVEFEGFVNYGSPIQTSSTNGLGQTTTNVITPNVINQPIFSTRKVTTSVSVFDGQTVVLGGLMSEDVQKVEDKVPLLGDIPLFGRLFRSNSEQHLKTNLVIFVTARLINPAGEAVHSEEETEEVVENLPLPEVNEPALPLMPK